MTTPPRRGRPPTGLRKQVLQVPLDPGDLDMIEAAAGARGTAVAELARALIKGEIAWRDIAKPDKRRAK